MVLFIGAGLVAVVGVVVAYRRQQGAEEGQFLQHLAEAARQLGDYNPSVQAAGIYALSGLADTERRDRRQQCVDVLCSYLRLPYSPSGEGGRVDETVSIVRKRSIRTRTGPVEEERTLRLRPHDRQTRHTIVRVIAQHLQKGAATSWSDLQLDFTNAVFDYGNFQGSVFSGRTDFSGAIFVGETTDFHGAHFAGYVDFSGAKFIGATVDFGGTDFASGTVSFRKAEFTSGLVDFKNSAFTGATVDFLRAAFTGATVDFAQSRFISGSLRFVGAKLSDGTLDFRWTEFTGCILTFRATTFSGGAISFQRATFTNGVLSLEEARFEGSKFTMKDSQFTGCSISFREPRSWIVPPVVPWETDHDLPTGIIPAKWPPPLQRDPAPVEV